MTYLVLWTTTHNIRTTEPVPENPVFQTPPTVERNHSFDAVIMNAFKDEQEAVEFANKHDGYIVLPAQIKSRVIDMSKPGAMPNENL